MTEISNIAKLPERRLHVRNVIALQPEMDFGQAIRIVKERMAQALAYKILESQDFFFERGDTIAGVPTLEYGVDCIVLTDREYADMQRASFKQGVEHSRGFMTMRVDGGY